MAFLGQVTIQLYYGTLYDDLNVPYYSSQIEHDATHISRLAKAAVWQSTWLTTVVADVFDYQAVVGAQYASIDDLGGDNHGRHWYKILSYSMISNKACLFQLEYDPLLSIGIGNITSISGIMRRWSVNDDTQFKWVKSAEPIDQADDFGYWYFRHNCVDDALGATTGTQLYGFPYDLSEKPTVEEYVNPNGETTQIFLPTLKQPNNPTRTTFISSVGGEFYFSDGFMYWTKERFYSDIMPNLNAAIGLGYELMSSCWALPKAENYITINDGNGPGGSAGTVWGKAQVVETGAPFAPSGYHNQKAADMGNYLSLYNEVTGDSVTVETCDLSTTNIQVMCNPYINGSFVARFDGYLHDSTGYSGQVKSGGWLPCNYTLGQGNGTSANLIANAQQVSTVETSYAAASNNHYASTTNARMSANRAYDQNLYNAQKTSINAVGNVAANWYNPGAYVQGGIDVAMAFADRGQADANVSTAYYNALRSADVSLENSQNARNTQLAILSTNGNIGKVAPPPTKFSNAFDVNANSYVFVVRWCSLSADDRHRLDNFLTAYGYNVDGLMLTDVSQLYTRQKFTFIQADDVEIMGIKLSTSGVKRIRDTGTVEAIKNRFAAGLRIWHQTPDYDYTKANPIK